MVSQSPFLREQRRLRLAITVEDAGARSAAQIDLVSFLMGHGLLAEARAALTGLDMAALSGGLATRVTGIEQRLKLLEGEPLDHPFASEDQHGLWPTLAKIYAPDTTPTLKDFEAAIADLKTESQGLQADLWPVLWQASLALGPDAMPMAKTLRSEAEAHGLAPNNDRHKELSGHMALLSGDVASAERIWLSAATSTSAAAARMRLLLATHWLRAAQPPYARARALLEDNRGTWCGDRLELGHYTLLARIYEETGALPEAVAMMGEILARFPSARVAELAEKRAAVLLPRLYQDGFKGRPKLTEFLETHEHMRRVFAEAPVFRKAWTEMAHWLREQGASAAAAENFAALEALSQDGAGIHLAAALLDGGQAERAWEAVSAVQNADAADWQSLAGQIAGALDTPPEHLPDLPEDPTAMDLRIWADLRDRAGDPRGAHDAWAQIATLDEATQQDAANLFLSAEGLQRPDVSAQAAGLLDPDGASRQMADIIQSPDRSFTRLRLTETEAQLDQTQAVLDAALSMIAPTETPSNPTDPASANRD